MITAKLVKARRNIMKKKSVLLGISLLLVLTGCGNKVEVPAVTTGSIDYGELFRGCKV